MSDEDLNVKLEQGNNVIYITEQASINWTNEATEAFVAAYGDAQQLSENGTFKTRRAVFDWISNELAKSGLYYHWTQCENKWKSLKRSFTNRAQKNPYILENPTGMDAILMEIFKKEKSSPIEFPNSEKNSTSKSAKKIDITVQNIEEEESVDELVDALVNNDEDYLGTLVNCGVDDDDEKDADSGAEHTYSFKKENKTETNQKRGVKRPAADLGLDIANEIVGLRNDLTAHHYENKEILTQNVGNQEKIAKVLSKIEQQNVQTLALRKQEIEKQSMIAQQLKIQNSLLAKLVHHFINSN